MKKIDYKRRSKERQLPFDILGVFVGPEMYKKLSELKKSCGLCECKKHVSRYVPGGKGRKKFQCDYHPDDPRYRELYIEYAKEDLFICNHEACGKSFTREKLGDFLKKARIVLK